MMAWQSIIQHRIPVLGGLGQLGTGLAKLLRKSYGPENVILSDIIKPDKDILDNGKIQNQFSYVTNNHEQ